MFILILKKMKLNLWDILLLGQSDSKIYEYEVENNINASCFCFLNMYYSD